MACRPAPCSIEGCGRLVASRKLCQKHYTRWKKFGDPLVVLRNTDLARDYLTKIITTPKGENCVIWPYTRDRDGYARIGTDRACRIICEAVNGPPPEPNLHAAHTCGKGMDGCVAPWHLVWKNAAANNLDKVLHGTSNKGETNPKNVLREADVLAIRQSKLSIQQLAKQYQVHTTTIRFILNRKTWRHLP